MLLGRSAASRMEVHDGEEHWTGVPPRVCHLSVTARTQFQRQDGHWQKRNERSGEFMPAKDDGTPFKGVAKEPDGRDTENS